jgi:tetratricopeptide (TPR) repeat protein
LAKEDYTGAESLFRRALTAKRSRPEGGAGPMANRRGGGNGPMAAMRQNRGDRPNAMAQIALVQSLIPQKKLKEAREILGKMRRNGRPNPMVQRLYGDAYAMEGNFKAAEESYRAAIQRNENGEDILKEIDAAKAAQNPEGEALVQLYKDSFKDRRESRRENRGSGGMRERLRERRQQRGGGEGGPGNGNMRERLRQRMAQNRGNMGGQGGPMMQGGGDGDQNPRAGFMRAMMARRRGDN